MGFVKWVRRRLDAASDNRKCLEYKTETISSTHQDDEIPPPTRAFSTKIKTTGKGKIFRRIRTKSAADDNRVTFAPPPPQLLRQTTYILPVDLDVSSRSAVDHDYEQIPEVQYENFGILTPPRRYSSMRPSSKPILHPRSELTRPVLHPRSQLTRPQVSSNPLGTPPTRQSRDRANTKMISSQSSPTITNINHRVRANSLERVLHDRNLASGDDAQYTNLRPDQLMRPSKKLDRTESRLRSSIRTESKFGSSDRAESKFRSSKSVGDLYDDDCEELSEEDVSHNPRPEPTGCEYPDLDQGNKTLVCENSYHDSDTPVDRRPVLPRTVRTPGCSMEYNAALFDVLPYDDVTQYVNSHPAPPSRRIARVLACHEKTPARCKTDLSRASRQIVLPRTPGCSMEYNAALFEALPYMEEVEEYYVNNNNKLLSESSSSDTDDEMSLSMMAQTIKVLQSQLSKKKKLKENERRRRRRSCSSQQL